MGVPAKSITIEELIPQRKPMVLIDQWRGIDADGVSHTALTVGRDNLFVEAGHMTECGVIEHMAQSAAARMGWRCRELARPVPVGFIGAVSRMTIHALPVVGARLVTSLRIVQQVGPLSLAACRTEADGNPVAEGELKIYLEA